jgi:hypothetical protein
MRSRRSVWVVAAFVIAGLLALSAPAGAVLGVDATPASAARAPSACRPSLVFELSLVSDRGGRPTPLAAARWFATHGDISWIPRTGWRLTRETSVAATIRSGRVVLNASRGADGTWQVYRGYLCT